MIPSLTFFLWGTWGKVLEDACLQAKSLQGDHWAGAWWRSLRTNRLKNGYILQTSKHGFHLSPLDNNNPNTSNPVCCWTVGVLPNMPWDDAPPGPAIYGDQRSARATEPSLATGPLGGGAGSI